jgi:hypothetical protein
MKLDRSFDEERFFFPNLGIGQTAFDGTNRLTRFVIVKSDALRAEVRVDHVDLVAFADRLVGTLRFTSAAVYTIFCNVGCHGGRLSFRYAVRKFPVSRGRCPACQSSGRGSRGNQRRSNAGLRTFWARILTLGSLFVQSIVRVRCRMVSVFAGLAYCPCRCVVARRTARR